jgi:hypothetical protein
MRSIPGKCCLWDSRFRSRRRLMQTYCGLNWMFFSIRPSMRAGTHTLTNHDSTWSWGLICNLATDGCGQQVMLFSSHFVPILPSWCLAEQRSSQTDAPSKRALSAPLQKTFLSLVWWHWTWLSVASLQCPVKPIPHRDIGSQDILLSLVGAAQTFEQDLKFFALKRWVTLCTTDSLRKLENQIWCCCSLQRKQNTRALLTEGTYSRFLTFHQ